MRSKSNLISSIQVTGVAYLWESLPSPHWYSHQDLPEMVTVYFTVLRIYTLSRPFMWYLGFTLAGPAVVALLDVRP